MGAEFKGKNDFITASSRLGPNSRCTAMAASINCVPILFSVILSASASLRESLLFSRTEPQSFFEKGLHAPVGSAAYAARLLQLK